MTSSILPRRESALRADSGIELWRFRLTCGAGAPFAARRLIRRAAVPRVLITPGNGKLIRSTPDRKLVGDIGVIDPRTDRRIPMAKPTIASVAVIRTCDFPRANG
jgi:hypothetical protein